MVKVTLKHIKDFHHWTRGDNGYYDIGIYASVVKAPGVDGYIGTTRTGRAYLDDVLDIIRYDEQFNLVYRKPVCEGEDPRSFVYKGKPYSLTWDPTLDEILTYKIIDLVEEKVITLDIDGVPPSPLKVLGKNWMPLVKGDELYIVLTIDPEINIIQCDIKTGKCTWVTPFENVQRGLPLSSSRGGSPLLYNSDLDLYIGLGHRTTDAWNHKPYLYTLSSDFKTSYVGPDIDTGKSAVEDPLSIYEEDGKIYCTICNWFVPGPGCVGLYEVTIE